MIDLYLFNTVINLIWYIFTVIFLLYRFTSFFNYIYNFIRFCSRLFSGIGYVYKQIKIYINNKRGYVEIHNDIESQQTQNTNTMETPKSNTFRETLSVYWNYGWNMVFGKSNTVRTNDMIPLVETRISSFPINNSSNLDGALFGSKLNKSSQRLSENAYFENKINELSAESKIYFNNTEKYNIEKYNKEKQFFEEQLNDLCLESTMNFNNETTTLKGQESSIYDKTLFQTIDLTRSELPSTSDTSDTSNTSDT